MTRTYLGIFTVFAAIAGCATVRRPFDARSARPVEVSGDWIDVRHATPSDTSLWVLRSDGYDGTAHIIRQAGSSTAERHQTKYATWYMRGSLADANRAICFARRLGRDGVTCLTFTLDTVATPSGPRRRLVVNAYPGQHTTGDRVLIAHDPL